jgi:hypothetical protein
LKTKKNKIMSCCGNKREELVQQLSSDKIKAPVIKMWNDVLFEYTGETSLTVKGNVTRTVYRFNTKGDIQLIDYRDASGMMAVTVLKKLNS